MTNEDINKPSNDYFEKGLIPSPPLRSPEVIPNQGHTPSPPPPSPPSPPPPPSTNNQ